MEKYFITYKFYNEDGQRLAIFGFPDEEKKEIKIYIITCSKKDKFSKVMAKNLMKYHLTGAVGMCNPKVLTIGILDDSNPKSVFLNYCESKYRKMYDILVAKEMLLTSEQYKKYENDFNEAISYNILNM